MRTLLLLAALTACEREAEQATAPTLAIPCVPDGGTDARCGVSRATMDGNSVLTVTEPDGGFRRLGVANDGAVATADGAAPARVASGPDGTVQVTVDDDRYSLPAR